MRPAGTSSAPQTLHSTVPAERIATAPETPRSTAARDLRRQDARRCPLVKSVSVDRTPFVATSRGMACAGRRRWPVVPACAGVPLWMIRNAADSSWARAVRIPCAWRVSAALNPNAAQERGPSPVARPLKWPVRPPAAAGPCPEAAANPRRVRAAQSPPARNASARWIPSAATCSGTRCVCLRPRSFVRWLACALDRVDSGSMAGGHHRRPRRRPPRRRPPRRWPSEAFSRESSCARGSSSGAALMPSSCAIRRHHS